MADNKKKVGLHGRALGFCRNKNRDAQEKQATHKTRKKWPTRCSSKIALLIIADRNPIYFTCACKQ